MGSEMCIRDRVQTILPWPTPVASRTIYQTNRDGSKRQMIPGLVPWATPMARDHKDGALVANVPVNSLLGRQCHQNLTGPELSSLDAETEATGALNPQFVRWLMGYPVEWGSCVAMAMR